MFTFLLGNEIEFGHQEVSAGRVFSLHESVSAAAGCSPGLNMPLVPLSSIEHWPFFSSCLAPITVFHKASSAIIYHLSCSVHTACTSVYRSHDMHRSARRAPPPSQAVQLMQSPKFSEKQAGYLFVSVLLTDSHELMEEVGKVVAADIRSDKQLECCLALHCVANIGGKILAEAVGESLGKLFKSRDTPPFVKKKVSLALLKLMREGSISYMGAPEYVKAMNQALQRTEYGVLTSATSLAIACGLRYGDEYEACVPDAITMLHRLTMKGCDDPEYV